MADATDTGQEVEAQSQEDEETSQGEATERLGGGSHKLLGVGYVGLMIAVVVVLWFLISMGSGLQAPPAETGGGSAGPRVMVSAAKILWKLLLATIVIIVACRLVGGLLRKIHQPHVIGEIIAGIMLGPSLLGAVWPSAFEFLFPVELMSYLDLLAHLGLIFYMFLVGLELDFSLMRGRGHAAIWVSHVSIIAPFLMGVALALMLYPALGSGGTFTAFGLFIGAAMAITAFPVLARILTDRGLYKTQIGTVALAVGAVDDVTAWCMLAVVITVAQATGLLSAATTIGLSLVFIAVMIFGVRPLLHRLAAYYERRGQLSGAFLATIFVGLLASAFITDILHIHVIFGAFLFGAIMPHHSELIEDLTEKLEDFSVVFLLPIFFTFSGIRTNVFSIGTSPKLWLLTLLILVVAIVGKWGGSKLAARFAGLSWREAGALGVLVNCRGLTELIILNIGLQMGVLPSTAFAMLVVMAVVTTLMTEPALTLYYPREMQRRMIKEQEEGAEEAGEEAAERWRILVAVGNAQIAEELAHVATLVGRDDQQAAEVTLLRVVDVSGTEVSHAPAVQETMLEEAVDRLRAFVQLVEDAGMDANPVAIAAGDVGETIARVANDLDVDLVLMGYHEALFGHRLLGGTVGEVLRDAEADVAVLVDPHGPRELRFGDGARVLVPYGGGFHEEAGFDLALRLAEGTGAQVTVLASADEAEEAEERASQAHQDSGVALEPVRVDGDVTEALFERAADVDLLVLGVGDRWMTRQETLATVREEVMEKAGTPYLVVRRHGAALGRLRRWWAQVKRTPQQVVDVYRGDGEPHVHAEEAGEQTSHHMEAEQPQRNEARAGTQADRSGDDGRP
ncbi:MAG: cation:proton antiporter [Actinomycetota bacterium]|nr:cation:proton antiporter [Actinomycetota bacterium]